MVAPARHGSIQMVMKKRAVGAKARKRAAGVAAKAAKKTGAAKQKACLKPRRIRGVARETVADKNKRL